MTARRHNFFRGFTLIELLVVIAVIAVLATICLPAVAKLSGDNSRVQSTNQVRALLAQARALAIARNTQAGVVFFHESARYSLPVHGNQVALQIIIADYDQAQYNPLPANTVFVAYSPVRTYLPLGVSLAALNDDPAAA